MAGVAWAGDGAGDSCWDEDTMKAGCAGKALAEYRKHRMARQGAAARPLRARMVGVADSMHVLALDTTTRPGSLALVADGRLLASISEGDARPHAERLPGDVERLLAEGGLRLGDIGLLAVAAGPGSFTGLRIGIAAIQGLAFAAAIPVSAVSALDAIGLAASRAARQEAEASGDGPAGRWAGAWMNAQRGEVFGALFALAPSGPVPAGGVPTDPLVLEPRDGPLVGDPLATARRWRLIVGPFELWLAGDGVEAYGDRLTEAGLAARLVPTPPLAPLVAELAVRRAGTGPTTPHAIRPVYVRRPDAVLARDRSSAPPRQVADLVTGRGDA